MSYVVESQLGDCSFSLEISGYQFPNPSADRHRSNKLAITITVRNLEGSWSLQKPSLLTWEVEDMIRWARGGYGLEPLLIFADPSIQLYASDVNAEMVHFQVSLSDQFLPAWHVHAPVVLDLMIARTVLSDFATNLETELSRFPYREGL